MRNTGVIATAISQPMPPTSNFERASQPVEQVIGTLSTMSALKPCSLKTYFDQAVAKWSTRLLVASGVLFVLLAVLAGIHSIAPLPRAALIGALGLAISVQLLALGALLLQIGSNVAFAVTHFRRFGESCQVEIGHDFEMAARLASYPLGALEAADRWIEQKLRRMERRQVRFFGGPDKLALAAVMIAGWIAWKEVGAVMLSWQPSPLLFGTAALVGLAVGGIVLLRIVDRLAYQRDILQIAKTLAIVSSVKNDVVDGGRVTAVSQAVPNEPVRGRSGITAPGLNLSAGKRSGFEDAASQVGTDINLKSTRIWRP